MLVIPFPNIDPVLIEFGPLAIRWYAIAFIGGILIGWKYIKVYVAKPPHAFTPEEVDDFLVWATVGVVLGARVGYVGFYNAEYYLANPLAMLQVWNGGLSFHGGLIGLLVALFLFTRKRRLNFLAVGDTIAVVAPIGLFFGRMANFINGELFGRVTDVPWGVVFPNGGPNPRHPSQIYESLLEGLVLFLILYFLSRNDKIRRRPGILSGVFLIGYAVARSFVELFRQPDSQIGFLTLGSTMGQLLSVPVLLLGLYLLFRPHRAT